MATAEKFVLTIELLLHRDTFAECSEKAVIGPLIALSVQQDCVL